MLLIYPPIYYIAKRDLVNSFYSDIHSKLDENIRLQIDSALELELDKRHLHYGFNHSNPLINRLKKATKNSHQKVTTILEASKDQSKKEIVESNVFQAYLYDPNAIDPDLKRWEFSLGSIQKPLTSRINEIPNIMEKYKGKELELIAKLRAKYPE